MKKATIDRSRQRFFGPEETLLERWETRREKRLIYLAPGTCPSSITVSTVHLERKVIAVLRNLSSAVSIS